MVEPDPLPAETSSAPAESAPAEGVSGGSYWSVSEESWARWGAVLTEEYATLLAPPVVVGATAAGQRTDQ